MEFHRTIAATIIAMGLACWWSGPTHADWIRRSPDSPLSRPGCNISHADFVGELSRIQGNIDHLHSFVEKVPGHDRDRLRTELSESLATNDMRRHGAAKGDPLYPAFQAMEAYKKISSRVANANVTGRDFASPSDMWLATSQSTVYILSEYDDFFAALREYFKVNKLTKSDEFWFQANLVKFDIVGAVLCSISLVRLSSATTPERRER